ncbi:IQ motif and SEC7 domain-containing protein 3 isoform X1 [Danio rerio]|uniref:IQ motif and SEC7 domain-containing protein 3 n=1 Tax=Danio rerio TaxID=7955 RepID=A0A8N7UUK6_DANRE|nr:IQ motif and SEC7 domain-containing protein 3 isoform X1 [Danio rerio]|eukprot:XP_682922.4 IQ motif and SEC7 domain-containing protein 3 isoform X1 [Danio rerio]
MSSLLENPLQAVLYLKELTAIVQNQQSLIQTQRYRIDILERRLEDLATENRQLRDSGSHHRHPPRYHPPPPPRTSSLPRTSRAETPPVQNQTPQQQQQQISPLDMQLVPAGPSTASPDSADEDEELQDPCCRSLVPQTPATLCRAVGLPRASESQTVLHQFCCPAPEAPEGESSTTCSSSVPAAGEEQKEEKRDDQPDVPPCSHPPEYELSPDLKQKQIEELEQKYGGPLISRRAACKIQTAFRQYQLSKNFQKIRNSVLESGIPRRMSVRRVRVQRDGFSAERALMEGCSIMGIPLTHSTSLPVTTTTTLTHLEDTFSEQVQSLARSIDEALSSWSTIRDGEGEKSSAAPPSGSHPEGLLMDPSSLQEATQSGCGESIPRSASKLMMAFRDVTVQIDNHNFRLSSSMLESVSLGNGVAKETVSEPQIGGQIAGQTTLSTAGDPEFPPPPPSEEEKENQQPIGLDTVTTGAGLEGKQTNQVAPEIAENSSDPISSSSTSTSACETMILSLPRPHCQNTPCGTLSTDIARKRLYRIGLNLFNVNPDKGIQFLISRGFIPDTAIGVAHFLLQRKGLSRQMIGEFLGNSKRQFNRDVLDCVVDEMDFSMLELDEALRKFQAHVRVQGEAQKVERLIEAFSQRYCMCNPDVVQQFHNPDTIFILAFAIVLLNTDMYSPNIKPERKMLLEDFIRNLRGVDDGADIPREMLAGIYERIQQRELRSNEDHVTYVTRVEQSILGMKTILSVPHRRLVCCSRLYEVTDVNKPQKQASHQREVFLFNDLIVILKLCPKKKTAATYTFCKAMGLLGMQFHLFENEYYPHGITILSPFSSEKKQVVSFCSQSADELLKFIEDLRESIAEVAEMEQIRIEWELERQQVVRNQTNKNGTQLDIHAGPSSASGDDFYEKAGSNTVEVSIHNRLQTYQLSSPLAPPSAQQRLAVLPSPAPDSALTISPDTLIQCQQIVKVIVVDSAGRGHVEAFLSHNPAHRLIQSAVSTPTRSREAGKQQQQQQQPPLPPPPPPYHHPHQFCPPTPPPPRHLLSQRRYSSGTRSLV